jgi:transcriptional regulator with XRE-family HTH domain
MTGYHTRWVLPDADPEDPERIAIRESLAFGKAAYDRRTDLGLTPAEVALRAGMTTGQIECIEEGSTEATINLLRRLAVALDADVRITARDNLGSVGFEAQRPDGHPPGATKAAPKPDNNPPSTGGESYEPPL